MMLTTHLGLVVRLRMRGAIPHLPQYVFMAWCLVKHGVLVGRPNGKRPLGRPRRRWEDKIKSELRETGIDEANWIRLAQDRVWWQAFVNTVMNLRVP
jgi:hypothetical protein